MTQKFHEPYSPAILETTVSERFVDIINNVADDVLSDEEKSKQWDFSHKLVGKVNKEILIPVKDKSDRDYLFRTMKQGCLDYLNYMVDKNRAHSYNRTVGEGVKPTIDNIHLTQSWVVSQYAGDFNPIHHHNGDFSAAIYLKVPEGMTEEWEEDFKDHYPAKGLIEFAFGENQNFRSDNLKFKPEVGKFLIFPSWLKHFVYPFSVEGERRMMSFNATIINRG
tara:strand:- start:125 stop:790 length:666 start_codon:yes stop_codon:yes gene_type:complete